MGLYIVVPSYWKTTQVLSNPTNVVFLVSDYGQCKTIKSQTQLSRDMRKAFRVIESKFPKIHFLSVIYSDYDGWEELGVFSFTAHSNRAHAYEVKVGENRWISLGNNYVSLDLDKIFADLCREINKHTPDSFVVVFVESRILEHVFNISRLDNGQVYNPELGILT